MKMGGGNTTFSCIFMKRTIAYLTIVEVNMDFIRDSHTKHERNTWTTSSIIEMNILGQLNISWLWIMKFDIL